VAAVLFKITDTMDAVAAGVGAEGAKSLGR